MRTLTNIGIAIVVLLLTLGYNQNTMAQGTDPAQAKQQNASADPDAVYYDALKAMMLGDKEEEKYLLQFIKMKPDEPAGYFNLSRLYLKQNKTDLALENIKKAIEKDKSGNKWYKEQYGNALAIKTQYLEAANVFMDLAGTEKQNEEYYLKASFLYQRAGKYKEALAGIDKLIEKTGAEEEFLLQKQQLYLKMNDVDGAAKVVQELIDKNPHEGRYYALLAELYENNKKPDQAIAIYEKAQKNFPDDPAIQLALANHFKKLKDEARYNEYLKKAITNKGLDAETQLGLLLPYIQEINVDAERKKDGMTLAEQLVEQHPDNVQVLSFYGDVLSLNNQRSKAIVQYKKAIHIDPSKYSVWQQLLFGYTDRSDADSLIYFSEKALKYFPNQAMIHYLNGIGHFNKKEYTAAIKSMNRAVDLQPEDNTELSAEMYSSLGDIYNLERQFKLSDSCYDKALRLDPKNASALNNYSYYLSVRGDRLEDAAKMSKQSLQLRPDEATFMDTYGWILYKQGKYEDAKKYIEKAIDKSAENADGTLFDHMGDISFKLNSRDKAIEFWKKAKEKGSDNPLIDKKINEGKLYE